MSRLTYATDDSESKAFEDYELWLRLIHSESPPQFANLGPVLLLLRKHQSNVSSGVPIESEVPMKVNLLSNHYIKGPLQQILTQNAQVTEEFIRVTGRPARSDTFSGLKQRKELSQIFH